MDAESFDRELMFSRHLLVRSLFGGLKILVIWVIIPVGPVNGRLVC